MSASPLTRSDIIKLGIDMCRALELCQRYNIIHRDIKPENIFVSRTGDYKLGDFGVARTLEKTTGGLSKKGTYTYMAPEIYRDEDYGSTVDIYSLGIVLYRLLNNNRAPFLPPPPQAISYAEREEALQRRIGGEPLPPPANARGRLAEIVLRACAYDPKDRYSSPAQMRQELEAIQYAGGEDELILGGEEKLRVERSQYTNQHSTAAGEGGEEKTVASAPSGKTKKKKTGAIALIAAVVVLAAIALVVLLPKLKGSDVSVGPVPSAAPTPAAVEATPAPTPAPPEETPAPEDTPAPEETPVPEETSAPTGSFTPDDVKPEDELPDGFSYEEEEETPWIEGDWSWSVRGSILTISGTGNMASYSNSGGRPWSDIADKITRIVVEDGITGIGDYAFYGCWRLSYVQIADSVTEIGDHAFEDCLNLTTLTIPGSVRKIGSRAFSYCYSLSSLDLPEGLVSVGSDMTIRSGSLYRVSIPASLSHIAPGAFSKCGKLSRLDVAEDSPYFKNVNGVLYSADGTTLVACPGGRTKDLQIPDGVVTIGERAFAGCYSLNGLKIPGTVREICDSAFTDCSRLPRLKLPEGVTEIGSNAFYNCEHMGSISLPASLTSIGRCAFTACDSLAKIEVAADNPNFKAVGGVLLTKDGTALICCPGGKSGTSYTVPEGVTEIGEYAFAYCDKPRTIVFPDGLAAIGDHAFYGCGNLGAVTIPDSVTSIGSYAFAHCDNLKGIEIPGSVATLGKGAFYCCYSLAKLTLPGSIAMIDENAFSLCTRLSSVTIPEGISVIGSGAFYGCEHLTDLNVPETLARIGSSAFDGCIRLKNVSFKGSEALWEMLTIERGNEPLARAKIVYGAA